MENGSSPRERGTLGPGAARDDDERFIPARAGNTHSSAPSRQRPAVHPRASGEHSRSLEAKKNVNGSSPRERGTRRVGAWFRARCRFIPARAGNTQSTSLFVRQFAVHPRASGEHTSAAAGCQPSAGSSPRERGTLGTTPANLYKWRFIPARAGNTAGGSRGRAYNAVHPRASGEHEMIASSVMRRRGSSPRERGTLVPGSRRWHSRRFIPARAGNTLRAPGRRSRCPVHPRASGEHSMSASSRSRYGGSSPRERGTRLRMHGLTANSTVHPRASGEHFITDQIACVIDGSSPRERGTRSRSPRKPLVPRFIPARAGNT